MLENKGTIIKIDKSWHHDLNDIIKEKSQITIDSIKKIKDWLSNGSEINNNDVFDKQIKIIKESEIIDNIFNEAKDLTSDERKILYNTKDDSIKKIWSINASIIKTRIEDYIAEKTELEGLGSTELVIEPVNPQPNIDLF